MNSKLITTIVLASASFVSAHGVQIQISYDSAANKIETRRVVATSNSLAAFGFQTPVAAGLTPVTRVYIMPLLDTDVFPGANPGGAGAGIYTRPSPQIAGGNIPAFPTGPGVCWQYDSTATVPGTFTGVPTPVAGSGWALNGTNSGPALVNLSGTRFGLQFQDSFKEWNGVTFVDPGTEQFQAFEGDATGAFTGSTRNAITSDSGAGPAFETTNPIGTTWSNNPHNSTSFRILGDGTSPSSPADDGIYLAKFNITSTALVPGTSTQIGASDPIYFVMYHEHAEHDLSEAIAVANTLGFPSSQIQVAIPEPTALGAGVVIGAAMLRRKRM